MMFDFELNAAVVKSFNRLSRESLETNFVVLSLVVKRRLCPC